MTCYRARLLVASVALFCFAGTAQSAPLTKAVEQACRADYHKFCDEYGLETAALRSCMNKAGELLSGECIQALIDAGEVSQAEVQRRAKAAQSDSTASIPSQPDSDSFVPPERWRPPD